MLRSFLLLLSSTLFLQVLSAQSESAEPKRSSMQDMTPKEALLFTQQQEFELFTGKLARLKTAFAEKNASQIVANEQYVVSSMRREIEQAEANGWASDRTKRMSAILAAFDGHGFNPAQAEAGARDFALLDEFLELMRQDLKVIQAGK